MNSNLPDKQVINLAFKEKGRSDVVKIDAYTISNGARLKLIFESTNSPWRQGVWLSTTGRLVINGQENSSFQIWQDSAPTEIAIECFTTSNVLQVYNIWDKGNGRESQSWTSGMLIEELKNGRRYSCNDVGFETAFDKLVFRVEGG